MYLSLEKVSEIIEEEGFNFFGITSSLQIKRKDFLIEWISKGYAGDMSYLVRNVEKRLDLKKNMENVKSIISLAINYYPGDFDEKILINSMRGLISRYAWGIDYHLVVKKKLIRIVENIKKHRGKSFEYRIYVDTGPVLEKEIAYTSGIGWIGKNTCFISEKMGSYLFLGEIFLDFELPCGSVQEERCSSCTRCIEACPTKAIISPRVLDARRCISYLTIENRREIPFELRPLLKNRIFGCDICQEVCPWNSKRRLSTEKCFLPQEEPAPYLGDIIFEKENEFKKYFKGRAVVRAKRRGLMRNVAVALGNSKMEEAIPYLNKLLFDSDPLVRAHAAWGLGEIGRIKAKLLLEKAFASEPGEKVKREIKEALERL